MKLEAGMYVRTLDGISRVIEARDNGVMARFVNEDGNVYFINDLANNPSHNIIDLIEVGDYVNGCLIVEIKQDPFIKGQINLWTNMILSAGEPFPNEYYKAKILEKDIKTIVTKEQFESMSYKVGE